MKLKKDNGNAKPEAVKEGKSWESSLMERFLRKKTLVLSAVVLLSALVFFSPQLFRIYSGNTTLIGQEPYFHLRAADFILGSGFSDALVKDPSDFLSPYDYLLSFFLYLGLDGMLVSRMLPLILGILFMVLVYLNLKDFDQDWLRIALMTLCVIFSPGLIFAFAFSGVLALELFLVAFAVYLFNRNSRLANYASIAV